MYIYIYSLERRLDEKGWVAAPDQTGDAYMYNIYIYIHLYLSMYTYI
jgi:hypothetical protein